MEGDVKSLNPAMFVNQAVKFQPMEKEQMPQTFPAAQIMAGKDPTSTNIAWPWLQAEISAVAGTQVEHCVRDCIICCRIGLSPAKGRHIRDKHRSVQKFERKICYIEDNFRTVVLLPQKTSAWNVTKLCKLQPPIPWFQAVCTLVLPAVPILPPQRCQLNQKHHRLVKTFIQLPRWKITGERSPGIGTWWGAVMCQTPLASTIAKALISQKYSLKEVS